MKIKLFLALSLSLVLSGCKPTDTKEKEPSASVDSINSQNEVQTFSCDFPAQGVCTEWSFKVSDRAKDDIQSSNCAGAGSRWSNSKCPTSNAKGACKQTVNHQGYVHESLSVYYNVYGVNQDILKNGCEMASGSWLTVNQLVESEIIVAETNEPYVEYPRIMKSNYFHDYDLGFSILEIKGYDLVRENDTFTWSNGETKKSIIKFDFFDNPNITNLQNYKTYLESLDASKTWELKEFRGAGDFESIQQSKQTDHGIETEIGIIHPSGKLVLIKTLDNDQVHSIPDVMYMLNFTRLYAPPPIVDKASVQLSSVDLKRGDVISVSYKVKVRFGDLSSCYVMAYSSKAFSSTDSSRIKLQQLLVEQDPTASDTYKVTCSAQLSNSVGLGEFYFKSVSAGAGGQQPGVASFDKIKFNITE